MAVTKKTSTVTKAMDTKLNFNLLENDEKQKICETIATQYRLKFLGLETFSKWGLSSTTGIFEYYGHKFVLVPFQKFLIGHFRLPKFSEEHLNTIGEQVLNAVLPDENGEIAMPELVEQVRLRKMLKRGEKLETISASVMGERFLRAYINKEESNYSIGNMLICQEPIPLSHTIACDFTDPRLYPYTKQAIYQFTQSIDEGQVNFVVNDNLRLVFKGDESEAQSLLKDANVIKNLPAPKLWTLFQDKYHAIFSYSREASKLRYELMQARMRLLTPNEWAYLSAPCTQYNLYQNDYSIAKQFLPFMHNEQSINSLERIDHLLDSEKSSVNPNASLPSTNDDLDSVPYIDQIKLSKPNSLGLVIAHNTKLKELTFHGSDTFVQGTYETFDFEEDCVHEKGILNFLDELPLSPHFQPNKLLDDQIPADAYVRPAFNVNI